MCTGSWPGTATVSRSLTRLSCLATFSTATKLATCNRREQDSVQRMPSLNTVPTRHQGLHVVWCQDGDKQIGEESRKDPDCMAAELRSEQIFGAHCKRMR